MNLSMRSCIWHAFAVVFLKYASALDIGSLVLQAPVDKPNNADVVKAEQISLGVINVNNQPGPDMTITNNMKDIKERVDAAQKNISRLKSEMKSQNLNDNPPMSLSDLNSEVATVTSSSSNVQEAFDKLKTRLENMKQTTSQTGSEVSIGSDVTTNLQESTRDLEGKVQALNSDVTLVLSDLNAMNSELDDLDLQLTSMAEEEERDDKSAVTNMEQMVSSIWDEMDSCSQTMNTNCKAMDKQFLQVQGINAIRQGERKFIKFPLKHATASSTFTGGDAMNVIDGSDEVYFYSTPSHCQATNYDWPPWLKLTLESRSVIGGLRVLPRGDCCYDLTNNVNIFTNVDDPTSSNNNELCLSTTSQLNSGKSVLLHCSHAREALYIFITSDINTQVSFCEIEALGFPGIPESTTYDRPALQSSSASVQTQAHLAVDNDVSTCARTKEASVGGNLWWMVDLQEARMISTVVLTFNNASLGEVRSGLDVFLYDGFPSFCDESSGTVCGSTTDNDDDIITVNCNEEHHVRYIRVIKHGALATEFLELCEVTAN